MTLLVIAMLCGGANGAWATTETFGSSKSSTTDKAITGTAVNIAGTSNPGGTGSYAVFGVSGEKGLKLRTGSALTFNVNFGYRITNITIKAYQNNTSSQNHNMTCGGFSVDGTTYNFDSAKEIPYNKESTSTDPVVISTGKISATSSVAFNFTNTSVAQNQIFAYVTVEYEAADFKEDFTAKGESTDPADYGFSLTYGSGSSSSLVNFSVTDGILKCDAGPYSSSSDGARTGTATATFDEIGSGNVIILNYKWALGNATGNTSGAYTKTRIGNSSGNALELSFYGSENNGSLKVNGTSVKTGNSSIRNTTYNISAKLDMNTRKITALTMTCSNATFSYSISDPIDFASAITTIDRFAFENSERQNWVNTSSVDDIILFKLVYPTFTLSDTEKEFYVEDSETVTLTGITGDISVKSDDTDVATVSYSDGTVTINGVAAGTTIVKVTGKNDGLTITKNIDVTINGFAAKYTAAKTPYDTKVESLDAAGQAYWTANVTDPATVTTSEAYATAVAALPTTYIAAVKAQTTKGSDMTDAMPTGNAGWTCNQGNGPASYLTTGATETYSDGTNNAKFAAGNIMSQTISGLPNGYYKVQFYGVVNAANSVSTVSGSDLVEAYANSTNLDIDVVLQNSCTPTDYLRTIEAQVTDGTLTYGLKATTGVTDAGNWAVAKIYKLTYLGTDKNSYTINAVAGETTIKELATGTQWASEDYGTYIPKVILYNSKYYVLDDEDNANLDGFYAGYIMGVDNATKQVKYTLDESIVFYSEADGNSYYLSQYSNNKNYSNGNTVECNTSKNHGNARNRGIGVGSLGKGIYSIYAVITGSGRSLCIRTNDGDSYNTGNNPLISISSTGRGNFMLTETKPIVITGSNSDKGDAKSNHPASFDYLIIRKLNVNDDPVVVGDINYATGSLGATTDKVTLQPGESYHYQFVNHNSGSSSAWLNYTVPVYNSSNENVLLVRADNWEDKKGTNAGCTNNFVWGTSNATFISEMDGATVDMTVSYSADNVFSFSADITTKSNLNWTYTYTSDYSGSDISLSGNIQVALSVYNSWLEVLSEGQTSVAATIGSTGWSTFASPYALNLSSMTASEGSVKAYYASSIGASSVTMTSTESSAVAAGEGLMLKGTPSATITIPVVDSGSAISGNKLVGVTNNITITNETENYANFYVLSINGSDNAEFQNLKDWLDAGNSVTINAGKAYLDATGAAARLSIVFDDETTGVRSLTPSLSESEGAVYNLSGQRVAQPTKGLYIVNGKKIIMK